jgi:hypothetical protein
MSLNRARHAHLALYCCPLAVYFSKLPDLFGRLIELVAAIIIDRKQFRDNKQTRKKGDVHV